MDHLPFGEDPLTGAGENEKHRFTTYDRDIESGLDYAVNRQYALASGRFLQPDVLSGQILYPKTLNRYAYSYDDPIDFYDPDGEIGVVAVAALVVLGSGVTGAILGAIFPPSGQSRWAGAGIGFLSGAVNGLFAVGGAATGTPAGILLGGFLGGSTSTAITDAFSNEGVSYQAAIANGLIGAATAGLGSLLANRLVRIKGNQYKLVYPGLRNFWGNLGRLFDPTRRLPLTGNVGRTAVNQLAGNAAAALASQTAVSINQKSGLGRPFDGVANGSADTSADQLLAVPRRWTPYGGFLFGSTAAGAQNTGFQDIGQIAVVNVNAGTIDWITPILSPVATPIPSPVVFPVP
jgi:RHS repeat-associated protein